MPRDIFISYRRADAADATGRIADHLAAHFGPDRVVRDLDPLRAGAKYRAAVYDAIGESKVVLAILGRGWRQADGGRNDSATFEIGAALRDGVPVLPVLVGRSRMPGPEALPPTIRDLARRNASRVGPDPDFRRDMKLLIRRVGEYVPPTAGVPKRRRSGLLVVLPAVVAVALLGLLVGALSHCEPRVRGKNAWAGPLAAAEVAAGSSDWREADARLREAEGLGLPQGRMDEALAQGVARWRRPVRLDVKAPRDGEEIEGLEVRVRGTLSGLRSTDRLRVNERPVDVESGTFEVVLVVRAEGTVSIDVEVRDGDELRARKTLRVVVVDPVPKWARGRLADVQLAAAAEHGVPSAFENEWGMRFVLVPEGTFRMGSPRGEDGRSTNEQQHEVTLTRPYYVQTTEVTNAQYRKWKRDHRSGSFKGRSVNGDRQPVVRVTWGEASKFASWLSSRDAHRAYRLPTEAEWERACRAGTTTRYAFGSRERDLVRHANFADKNDPSEPDGRRSRLDDGHGVTAPVASYRPSAWALYDMHGNVWEWCLDWYAKSYPRGRVMDPRGGPPTEKGRVVRGGSWRFAPRFVRSATRGWDEPTARSYGTGFRLVVPLSR